MHQFSVNWLIDNAEMITESILLRKNNIFSGKDKDRCYKSMPQPETSIVISTSRKISNRKCHSNIQEKALLKLNEIIKDTKNIAKKVSWSVRINKIPNSIWYGPFRDCSKVGDGDKKTPPLPLHRICHTFYKDEIWHSYTVPK